ncbi:hypothetical protein CROQUDRAFT_97848 [Cronartium quercuum f. sp. fusiforme G11]|uniref:Uncharacterized protein n=1 Tax=Cronartium quercuum f. sp. fusiforme G11 TaxID=708437 RepID=A0A9P6NAS8_9BASI|nr:hypothetical protein CROQUDRAFT_97848 [Cronartium quercuum f. sp. fusiforme G11]
MEPPAVHGALLIAVENAMTEDVLQEELAIKGSLQRPLIHLRVLWEAKARRVKKE